MILIETELEARFKALNYNVLSVDRWGRDYRVILKTDQYLCLRYVSVLSAVVLDDGMMNMQLIINHEHVAWFLE